MRLPTLWAWLWRGALLVLVALGIGVGISHLFDSLVFEDLLPAVRHDNADRVAALLDRDPSLLNSNPYPSNPGYTLLHLAAMNGSDRVAALLLEHGLDVNARDSSDRTPLLLACEGWGNPATVRLLVDASAEPNVADGQGWSPLHLCAIMGREDEFHMVLRAGGSLQARAAGGWTVLHAAALAETGESARWVLAAGGDVGAVDNEGRTALKLAQEEGRWEAAAVIDNYVQTLERRQ
jgi:ankyrin repeat protein